MVEIRLPNKCLQAKKAKDKNSLQQSVLVMVGIIKVTKGDQRVRGQRQQCCGRHQGEISKGNYSIESITKSRKMKREIRVDFEHQIANNFNMIGRLLANMALVLCLSLYQHPLQHGYHLFPSRRGVCFLTPCFGWSGTPAESITVESQPQA